MKESYKTLRIPEDDRKNVENLLKEENLKKKEFPHSVWRYEGKGVYITLYKSGILLIQGRNVEEWKERILSVIKVPENPVAGCDEAGKGDIFGPLVICCAVIEPQNYLKVLEITPKDTKRVEDDELKRKVEELKKYVYVKCINIRPERFNELYEEFRNINTILERAYERLTDFIKKEKNPERIVIDAFKKHNPFKGDKIIFKERGEEDIAVSVASMFARYKLLKFLEEHELPKGSSEEAIDKALEILNSNRKTARGLIKECFLKNT